jgi:hypothetical protein
LNAIGLRIQIQQRRKLGLAACAHKAGELETPAGYWDFQKLQLRRVEEQWIAIRSVAGAKIASADADKNEETR